MWIIDKNGSVKRLEYVWSPYIYVASSSESELAILPKNSQISPFIKEYCFEYKFEYPADTKKNKVLKLTVKDSSQIVSLSKNIEKLCKRFGYYRLYNVDISPEQTFLYEKNIYPLGLYQLKEKVTAGLDYLNFDLIDDDDINSFDYILPNFRFLSFEIITDKKSIVNNFNDKILMIKINSFNHNDGINERFLISEDNELETILKFAYKINRIDPDIILTTRGDQFLFPHLIYRAKIHKIETQLLVNLNREVDQNFIQKKYIYLLKNTLSSSLQFSSSSSSYLPYGKVYFRPRPFFLYGRIHIDINTSFIYKDNGLYGLSEISRVCRIPLQLASRSTIGKCLSSLYFYNAQKEEILVPWKPTASESFKTFSDLLKADKGGFVFESKAGVYEKVAEFDFESLYPNIMFKQNVSSETINCECCKFESDNKVPELEHLYHICKKRIGIVPYSLKTVLDRRSEYKMRKNNCASNKKEEEEYEGNRLSNSYDQRQKALKWILVTSFGYLGFNNSKFGRIDAHIAVCAFARDILLKTSKIAENHGFEIIHGIVDSIWIRKSKVNNMNIKEYRTSCENLKKDIEEQTGFKISFEGIYKWIVFDSSKVNPELPALNRYFGVFENGEIKARGIETRRHDTPQLFVRFQEELLQIMSTFNSIDEIIKSLPILEEIYHKYRNLISSGKVIYSDLVFTKRISKDSDKYDDDRKTIENWYYKDTIKPW